MTRPSITHQAPSGSVRAGSHRVHAGIGRAAGALLASALLLTGGAALAGGPASVDPNPRHLVDDEGTAVDITGSPQRVISLSPSNTEIVFALGAGDRLVGGTDADDYPPEAADLPDVANYTSVFLEQVIDLQPDLVLAAGNGFNPPAAIQALRSLGYPVLVLYAETMDGVIEDVRLVASALAADDAGEALASEMDADVDAVTEAVAAVTERPRTFYQIGWSDPQLFAPPPNSVYADLIALAGGEPLTTGVDDAYTMSLEALVDADPEVILLGDSVYPGGACPADVAARPGWGTMTAVVEGDIRPVNDVVVTRPGPRITEGLASVARGIHPDLELPGFAPDPPMCDAAGSPAHVASVSPVR